MNKLIDSILQYQTIRIIDIDRFKAFDEKIGSIIIVGSSCTGKTTLVRAIRESSEAKSVGVEVPMRFITRPRRDNDDLQENRHLTRGEFLNKIKHRQVDFSWVRPMEGNRKEQYAFEKTRPSAFPVYSANNAIVYNINSVSPQSVLSTALIVGVYAPDEIRLQRLETRSPDLKSAEVKYRLGDSPESILDHTHIAADNYGVHERYSKKEIIDLASLVSQENDTKSL